MAESRTLAKFGEERMARVALVGERFRLS